MRVRSSYLPAQPELITGNQLAVVSAFDTLVDEKSLVVGLALGSMDEVDHSKVKFAGAAGRAVLDRCLRHQQLNYRDGPVVIAGVESVTSARQRTWEVLAGAASGSLVLFICPDGKVYEVIYEALHVDLQSLRVVRQ